MFPSLCSLLTSILLRWGLGRGKISGYISYPKGRKKNTPTSEE